MGLDGDINMIEYAARFFPGPVYMRAMIEDKPWEYEYGEHPFRAVVSVETIEHCEDPLPYLQALRSAVTPGSVFIGTTPNAPVYTLEAHRARDIAHGGLDKHYYHYTHQELNQLFQSTGWGYIQWWGQRGELIRSEEGKGQKTCHATVEIDVHPDTIFLAWIAYAV